MPHPPTSLSPPPPPQCGTYIPAAFEYLGAMGVFVWMNTLIGQNPATGKSRLTSLMAQLLGTDGLQVSAI